jgi:methylenetetrahydrofolate dehydrogenase (NADP+)/methenyltetrahydrofolate cyclohydrolase
MAARIIDGRAIAEALRLKIAQEVERLRETHRLTPGLAVVLVGDDPASPVYIATKANQTRAAGMLSFEHRLAADTPQDKLLGLIAELNRRQDVHGILLQLPLPKHIEPLRVIEAIDPAKDVDGFHPINVGRLVTGATGVAPCTPTGCLLLAKSVRPELKGLEAVVVGRSNIVGKPMAYLLLQENCTPTIAHSHTRDLADVVRRADLVVAAAGRPGLIKGDWIKPGAIVIDVGIQRVADGNGKTRLVGDVDFKAAAAVAGAITPVPGGVGPMTVACLLQNTLRATERAIG